MLRKVPLIVILGSTGTGKTKLSIELAERFGGEIISADSMQVYANLDIATAKATKEEQARAKHHLLDVATPSEPFSVLNFRNRALPIIENLLSQSKCPIIVGGTNYYIESLLWDILVSPTAEVDAAAVSCREINKSAVTTSLPKKQLQSNKIEVNDAVLASENSENSSFIDDTEMLTMSSEYLHNHLRNIDPDSANRIHPNNKRKIMRAIEFYQHSGQTLSARYKEQRQQPGGNRLGGPLRYPHTILFWLKCNQDVLNNRLDKRVDAMLEQGLLREIRAFNNDYNSTTLSETSLSSNASSSSPSSYPSDVTKGVLQTIGFKEFIPYLANFDATNDQKIEEYLKANEYKMPTEEMFKQLKKPAKEPTDITVQLPPGLELLKTCLEELKLVTRRYSKRQQKWINNRFLASKDRQVPDLYELDTSDVSQWHERVFEPAINIIDSYRNGQICEIEPMTKREHPGAGLDEEVLNFCQICERNFIGEYQWQLHLKSNKHKRRKEGLKKKALKAIQNQDQSKPS